MFLLVCGGWIPDRGAGHPVVAGDAVPPVVAGYAELLDRRARSGGRNTQ